MITEDKVRAFEDEQFYGLLDVCLDIKGEADFGASEIRIPVERRLIRYPILVPIGTPGMLRRYGDLRLKVVRFLEVEGYLADVIDERAYWEDPGEGQVCLRLKNKDGFNRLFIVLTAEEVRRNGHTGTEPAVPGAMARIEQLCDRFHRAALRMRENRAGSNRFCIEDEYDVQILLAALLETQFKNIKTEETTPSRAGRSAKVDLLLGNDRIVIETKMTRDGLRDGELGQQLTLDIAHYRKHPDCKAMMFFVYDPKHLLKNPDGLEADISTREGGVPISLRIRPHR